MPDPDSFFLQYIVIKSIDISRKILDYLHSLKYCVFGYHLVSTTEFKSHIEKQVRLDS